VQETDRWFWFLSRTIELTLLVTGPNASLKNGLKPLGAFSPAVAFCSQSRTAPASGYWDKADLM
jgi:hypothetical protein